MVSNFCSSFSWYGKRRPADIEIGPQPFIISYYDSLLPIDSDEIIKRLQQWLNNAQC